MKFKNLALSAAAVVLASSLLAGCSASNSSGDAPPAANLDDS